MKSASVCVVSKEELENLVNTCKSYRDIGRKLNKDHNYVRSWIVKFQIDDSKIKNKHTSALLNKNTNLLKIEFVFLKQVGKYKRKYVICSCACGNTCTIRFDSINKTLSCGCLTGSSMKRTLIQDHDWQNYKINQTIMSEIKKNALRRNIVFNLDIKYLSKLFEQQKGKCALSGMSLQFSSLSTFKTASLDRIDSREGYIEGNVQWVHKDINKMKTTFDQNNFIELCALVTKYQNTLDKSDAEVIIYDNEPIEGTEYVS